jgi:hypothetical protein
MHLTDRQIAIAAAAGAVGAFLVAAVALYQTRLQYSEDYSAAVVIGPGALPIKAVPSDESLPVELVVVNTSRKNLSYFLKVESNLIFVSGTDGKPTMLPGLYESSIVTLSNSDAGAQKREHKLELRAPIDPPEPPGISPVYYIEVRVIDASNGKTLALSKCYYDYRRESKLAVLYQPVFTVGVDQKPFREKCEA